MQYVIQQINAFIYYLFTTKMFVHAEGNTVCFTDGNYPRPWEETLKHTLKQGVKHKPPIN